MINSLPVLTGFQIIGLETCLVIHGRNIGDIITKIEMLYFLLQTEIQHCQDIKGSKTPMVLIRVEIEVHRIHPVFTDIDYGITNQSAIKPIVKFQRSDNVIKEKSGIVPDCGVILLGIAFPQEPLTKLEIFIGHLHRIKMNRYIVVVF